MKDLSESTRCLIRSLHESGGVIAWLRGAGFQAATLRRIGAAGEPAAIPHLAGFLLDRSRTLRDAASDAVHSLLTLASPLDLPQLDRLMRERSEWRSGWESLRPEQVASLGSLRCPVAGFGLASFHRNGFVRELAVAELDRTKGGSEIPFLLIRLNDWVPKIRALALSAMSSKINPNNADKLIANFPLVDRLRACSRVDHAALIRSIEDVLLLPDCRGALIAGFSSADRKVRQLCSRLLPRLRDGPAIELARGLLASPHVSTRWAAASRLISSLVGSELHAILDVLHLDRCGAIRCEALMALARTRPEEAEPRLREALLDPKLCVREGARYLLRERGWLEFATTYREACGRETGRCRTAAIKGLGETGKPTDAEVARAWLSAPEARNRKAALVSFSNLSDDPAPVLDRLIDPHPSVSRTAREILRRNHPHLPCSALAPALDPSSPLHVRINAVLVLEERGNWDAIPHLLFAAVDTDIQVASAALEGVRSWLSHPISYRPSPDQLRRFEEAFQKVENALPAALRKEVAFALRFEARR